MAKMAGKPSSIPACLFHCSILAFAALIFLSFSIFFIKSHRYPAQIQNQYNSHLSFTNFLTDNLKPSFDGSHSVSSSSIYHSPQIFSASYAEMERKFKVYIYPDGDRRLITRRQGSSGGSTQVKGMSFRIYGRVGFIPRILIKQTFSSIPSPVTR